MAGQGHRENQECQDLWDLKGLQDQWVQKVKGELRVREENLELDREVK